MSMALITQAASAIQAARAAFEANLQALTTQAATLANQWTARQNSLVVFLHLNAATGNDANDGSAGAPLRTFDRALALVPRGGLGRLILQTDIAVNSFVLVESRRLEIYTRVGDPRRSLSFPLVAQANPAGSTNGVFFLRQASVELNNINLVLPPPGASVYNAPFYGVGANLELYNMQVTLPDGAAPSMAIGQGTFAAFLTQNLTSNRPLAGFYNRDIPEGTANTAQTLMLTNLVTL